MDKSITPAPTSEDTSVPHTALVFLCPSCECPLEYQGSHAADSGHADTPAHLNDYYRCPAGCGTFEHERQRHRFRLVEAGYASNRR
jgi:hypothetical protein